MTAPEYVRSERYIRTALGWYVRTREQTDLGPFATAKEAEAALSRHILVYSGITPLRNTSEVDLGMGIHDPETCLKVNCATCLEAREFAALPQVMMS